MCKKCHLSWKYMTQSHDRGTFVKKEVIEWSRTIKKTAKKYSFQERSRFLNTAYLKWQKRKTRRFLTHWWRPPVEKGTLEGALQSSAEHGGVDGDLHSLFAA